MNGVDSWMDIQIATRRFAQSSFSSAGVAVRVGVGSASDSACVVSGSSFCSATGSAVQGQILSLPLFV